MLVKLVAKFAGVWPLTCAFRISVRDGYYTTLLMSTGLTFGSISALFGLNNGIIDRGQYSVLVSAVIVSALVPTLSAQSRFYPHHAHAAARTFEEQPRRLVAAAEGASASGADAQAR